MGDDLAALPPHVTGQLIAGTSYATPRPAGDHVVASASLFCDLAAPLMRGRGGAGGWWLVYEPALRLGDDVLVPDMAAWRHGRMPEYPAGPSVTLAPDWVCEVLSPQTAKLDRDRKMPRYAEAGVAHLWLLDPRKRTLETYSLDHAAWMRLDTYGADATVRAHPFTIVEIELATLWLNTTPANADEHWTSAD